MSHPENPSPPASPVTPIRMRPVLWFLALGLFANAAVMLYTHFDTHPFPDLSLDAKAYAQIADAPADRLLGAKGFYMMPAQLGVDTWGLYLMDVDSGTICVYRASPATSRFRLMAARSFKYDRFLDDLNNDSPTPKEVQKQVQDQRQRDQLERKDEPKP